MAVAKSYEKYKITEGPFEENKRMYVILENGKKVRWYTDSQRAAMDKKTVKPVCSDSFSHYKAFGFGPNNFITIFKGNKKIIDEWASPREEVRFATFLGWYVPCTYQITDLPDGVESVMLPWDMVKADDIHMREYDEISKIVENLTNIVTNNSTYQGIVGEWLDRNVTIKKNVPVDGHFGESRVHIMEDNDGNEYVWITASKNLEAGFKCVMHMKVKEHKEYNDVEQTVVYYCKMKE